MKHETTRFVCKQVSKYTRHNTQNIIFYNYRPISITSALRAPSNRLGHRIPTLRGARTRTGTVAATYADGHQHEIFCSVRERVVAIRGTKWQCDVILIRGHAHTDRPPGLG